MQKNNPQDKNKQQQPGQRPDQTGRTGGGTGGSGSDQNKKSW